MSNTLQRAVELHKAGQLAESERHFLQHLSEHPDDAAAAASLAFLLTQMKRARDALIWFGRAIDRMPGETHLIEQAVQVAVQLGENVYAEKWLGTLLKARPDDLNLAAQYVGVLIAVHKEHEALQWVNQLIKKAPQNPQLLNLKGMCLSRLSEGEKAYKYFEKAIRLNPGQVGVVRNLIIHGKGKKQSVLDEIVPQYEQKLAQPGMPDEAKMNIAYVVSMYYDKRDEAEKSFKYLQLGNQINRSRYQYSHQDTLNTFKLLRDGLSEDLLEACRALPALDGGDAPIFILGMPRSGTTLIEQILSSHSLVEAEGELQTLSHCFQGETNTIVGNESSLERAEAARRVFVDYLHQVRGMQHQRGAQVPKYFTDKMPYNFMMAGFIAAAMPEAKIVHCTRDPLETCFSIYKQNFSGTHGYKNDLRELGMYFNLYQDHMAHVEQMFPEQIFEANYERMVSDSEAEIRRLLDYCGLSMESDCLMFHKNKRAVRTASVAQVRQPIYKDAVRASKPFEKQLASLIEVLESGEGRLS